MKKCLQKQNRTSSRGLTRERRHKFQKKLPTHEYTVSINRAYTQTLSQYMNNDSI